MIEVWLNNKLTVIINFWHFYQKLHYFENKGSSLRSPCCQMRSFDWFSNSVISKPQNNNPCSTVVICSFPKWTPWKFEAIRRRRSCSIFVLCRSYFLPGRNSSSAFASKPSAINGKCYNSWVVVVVLSCSPFFASHPQSQFGKAHSTRPTSLVTRVVLTSVDGSKQRNETQRRQTDEQQS